MKNVFSSMTFWGILLTVWLSVSPEVEKCVDEGCTTADYVDMTSVVAASLISIIGRYRARKPLFTPKVFQRKSPKDSS